MTSYYTLEPGAAVRASDGTEIGKVEHVLADAASDIFDGLVIDVRPGPGGQRFVDAPQVAQMDEDGGVTLTLDADAVHALPKPSANPATMHADATDLERSTLNEKLHRAWDMISGKG
jgi:hypothetical protein